MLAAVYVYQMSGAVVPAQAKGNRPSLTARVLSVAAGVLSVRAVAVAQVSLPTPGGGTTSVMLSVPKPVPPL